MCSTCKQRKLTVKRVVSKQMFAAIKFPLFVGAQKNLVLTVLRHREKEQRTRPNFPLFTYI
jgi:hypothetical protein